MPATQNTDPSTPRWRFEYHHADGSVEPLAAWRKRVAAGGDPGPLPKQAEI